MRPRDLAVRDAVREAVLLPAIFLTVVLGCSVRSSAAGGDWRFELPTVAFLGLALLVLTLLVRAGALVPARLMHADRRPLENLSGAIVLVTLFAASAQLLSALAPEQGLLRLLVFVYFLLLLSNTQVLAPDAARARRSLLLILMAALMFKHVVLSVLFAPDAGFGKRLLTMLLEGVTLGGIEHEAAAPAAGYVAFAAVLLYMAGLSLLPQAPRAVAQALARVEPE